MKTKQIFKGTCNKNDEYLVGLWTGDETGYSFCSCRKVKNLGYKFNIQLECCKACGPKMSATFQAPFIKFNYCHDIFLFEESEC